MLHFYSRMRSKGSRFTLGVWGLRVCSLDSRRCATVRNRLCEGPMAVPMETAAKGVTLNVAERRLVWQACHIS